MRTIQKEHIWGINLLLTLVFLFNAFSPLFHSLSQSLPSEDTSQIEELFGNKVLICTPFGYQYVDLDDLENDGNATSEDPTPKCSLCLISILAADLYIPSFSQIPLLEFNGKKTEFISHALIAISFEFFETISPRAPPRFL